MLNLLKETLREWREDGATRLAAALAYYTTFSLAPLLVLVIAIAGLVGGREAAQMVLQVHWLFCWSGFTTPQRSFSSGQSSLKSMQTVMVKLTELERARDGIPHEKELEKAGR